MGHWLGLRVTQPGPNRDAIGAWVEVQVGDRRPAREMTVGGGHEGGQLGWVHVGLGSAPSPPRSASTGRMARWGPWLDVRADGFSEIERGATEARPWRPPGG